MAKVGIAAPEVSDKLGGVPGAGKEVIGVDALVVAPALVRIKLFILPSARIEALLGVFNKSSVWPAVIAEMFVPEDCVGVKGLIEGVKFPVYTSTPFTKRTLEIFPEKKEVYPD